MFFSGPPGRLLVENGRVLSASRTKTYNFYVSRSSKILNLLSPHGFQPQNAPKPVFDSGSAPDPAGNLRCSKVLVCWRGTPAYPLPCSQVPLNHHWEGYPLPRCQVIDKDLKSKDKDSYIRRVNMPIDPKNCKILFFFVVLRYVGSSLQHMKMTKSY